jgi:hypothetical protein
MPIQDINLNGPIVIPSIGALDLPTGGNVRYVYQDANGNGIASLSNVTASLQDASDLTVAAAFGKCRANRGDRIIVLPGHVEAIATTGWPVVAGVTVISLGNDDSDMPNFNWTAAGSNIAFNAKGVRVIGGVFNFAVTAATNVAEACTISAATRFERLKVIFSTSSTVTCTNGFNFVTGADRSGFDSCYGVGNAAGASKPILLTNAIDSFSCKRSTFIAGTSGTGQGVIQAAAAATNWTMDDCVFLNSITSSTAAVVGFAGATGFFSYVLAGITAATGGATAIGTPGNIVMAQCFGGVLGKDAIAITPASG